ncbi:hypothetical protein LN572_07125, partial [Xanthomonas citri pv. fuscans]|nr:hypothetical protein [Xanthomonas citri pv. fuscans]
ATGRVPRLGALVTDAATPPAEHAMQVVPAGQTAGTAGTRAVRLARHPSAPSGDDAPCRVARAYFKVLR